jgi:hypothetical protein
VQRAARRVAQENAGLRSLLAHKGVSQAEINDFLRSSREAPGSDEVVVIPTSYLQSFRVSPGPKNGAVVPATYPNGASATSAQSAQGVPQPEPRISPQSQAPFNRPILPRVASSLTLAHIIPRSESSGLDHDSPMQSVVPTSHHPATISNNAPNRHPGNDDTHSSPVPDEPGCPNATDCFCPSPIATRRRPPGPGLEISCEAAATIIVEMRGDGDIESARASLGCFGREDCNVKNSTVLQIMDER